MPIAAATGAPNATQTPDGWNVVRLGEVCSRPQYGANAPAMPFNEALPRYVRVTDITDDGRLRSEDPRSADPVKTTGYELREGDLLFARSGSVGRTYLHRSGRGSCVYAGYLIRFRALPDVALPEFLERWTRSQFFMRWVRSMQRAGAQPNINATEYSSLPVLLPPLSEQRAIAAVLDSIDEAIERTDDVIAATERLRDSLLHELLTRGLPGQHSEWKQVPGLGSIPALWKVIHLGDVAEVRSGQVDPRNPELQHLQFVAPDDVESATGRLILRRRVSDAGAISGKYEFDDQDVIYSKIRPYLMKVYLPKNRGLCSADMYPIRPRRGLTRGYLALVLVSPSFTDYARTCSDRTGIPKINRRDLLQFQLRLPPLAEQWAIAAVLDRVDAAIERAREERCDLRSLQAATSEALLTGRVRVDQRE